MLGVTKTCILLGIDGHICSVETDISFAMPAFDIVGLADLAVKESKERIRAAAKNSDITLPSKKIIVNLAPANVKKEGSHFDLPILVSILAAANMVDSQLVEESVFIGELSLDGSLRSVSGVLPMIITARQAGIKTAYVPHSNANEGGVIDGIDVIGVKTISALMEHLMGENILSPTKIDLKEFLQNKNESDLDFSDVRGQDGAKRAVEIAAAGGHNLLLIGSPGSGKTMIAQRIPSILPDLTFEEALEVSKVHSIAGALSSDTPVLNRRPFRHPHHTISSSGLSGGGKVPKPGEISLAHNGVLFLDELPEFRKDALEVMRQPLEDGTVTISRVSATLTYPAAFMLIASMNPCKCGYYGDSKHTCRCKPADITNYIGRISGPLIDRIDIQIEVPSLTYDEISATGKSESSKQIKARVDSARAVQNERYKEYHQKGIYNNSDLTAAMLDKYCWLGEAESEIMKNAFDKLGLSARAYSRILKVSRTIADLDKSDDIKAQHIAEALQYRSLDRKYWAR